MRLSPSHVRNLLRVYDVRRGRPLCQDLTVLRRLTSGMPALAADVQVNVNGGRTPSDGGQRSEGTKNLCHLREPIVEDPPDHSLAGTTTSQEDRPCHAANGLSFCPSGP